jgi:trigger factor
MLDSKEFKRNTDYIYSFSFEIKPEIDLPEYHGLKAKQKKVKIKEEQVERALENLRLQYSKFEVVKEDRKPKKGDLVVVSFKFYDGERLLEDVSKDFFEFYFGVGDALEDFEKLIADLVPGEKNEGEITFPEDFLNKDLAGKTIKAVVELHSLKERVLPEPNDEFAKKFGMETIEELKERLKENLKRNIEEIKKSIVQKKLLDEIVSKVEVVLPESLVERQIESMIEKERERLEIQGKDPDSLGSEEELKEKFREEAEEIVKAQLVLLEIAEKEDLTVTNEEVEQKIALTAYNMGVDPQVLKEFYIKNNLMFALRDSILADKAMDKVYEYAEIEYEDMDDKEQEQKDDSSNEVEEKEKINANSAD